MHDSIVSEELYHKFSFATTAISCISNLLLINILAATNLTHVGPYRFLLLIFAVVDVLISLVHLALVPAIHMTSFGYIYFGYRFIHASTFAGVLASLIWVLLFYQTFVLLAFHYVYRYVMLCSPDWLAAFNRRPWRNWLLAMIAADVTFVGGILLACFAGLLPTDISRKAFAPVLKEVYNIDLFSANQPGYLGIVYWIINDNGEKEWITWNIAVIGWVILLFFSTALVILTCTIKIIKELNDSRLAKIAPATKRFHKQLFNTLLWQTIIPCFTSYTPLGMLFLVPLTGVSLGGVGTVLIMSTALFPMIDPYIVIFLITGYRNAFYRMIFHYLRLRSFSSVAVTSRNSNALGQGTQGKTTIS